MVILLWMYECVYGLLCVCVCVCVWQWMCLVCDWVGEWCGWVGVLWLCAVNTHIYKVIRHQPTEKVAAWGPFPLGVQPLPLC